MRVELKGFAPDLDPMTPGAISDCDALFPTNEGMAAAYGGTPTGHPDLGADAKSAFVAQLLDGTKRLMAATSAAIYESSGLTWVDRSRTGGYTGTNRQRFEVFGNVTLAANRTQIIGASSAGAAFVDIAGSPAAAILCTASGFVLAFDTNDGVYGDRPDGWWCSGIRDHTVWTPAAATQCANGRLLDSPGRITAAHALGSDVIAYKGSSMYMGRYVGPPFIWSWSRIPGNIGTSGNESVVVVDTKHYFVGPSDFYVYDGTVPISIGENVRRWFFDNLNASYRDKVVGTVDIARNIISWWYPSTNSPSGAIDSLLTYNYMTGQWGKWARTCATPLLYTSSQITYDGMGTLYATWDDLPNIPYDSPFWLADQTVQGFFIGGKLYSLTYLPLPNWFTTNVFGDMVQTSRLKRVTPRYITRPASATASNYYANDPAETMTLDSNAAMHDGRFDFRRSARYHQIRVTHPAGAMVIKEIDIEAASAGRR